MFLITVASSLETPVLNPRSNVLQMKRSYEVWEESDRIYKLPGVARMPKFPMYSGYLDSNNTNHVFYWYVKSF